METSDLYKGSHNAVPSPDNRHIACLNGARLQIRSTASFEILRTITFPLEQQGKIHSIRWSRPSAQNRTSHRILVSNEDGARVWDICDAKWNAQLNNGSGGMGKIVHADFGRSETEIILFSDFNSKVTVWDLETGRSVEIKDPKFSTAKASVGYGYRPTTGNFALLSRPGPQDMITLHAPKSYHVLKTIPVASSDAQGMKWSPDGRWLVVWDSPAVGYRIFVYTADGNLYRMYSGEQHGDVEGLGVKSVDWSPNGEYLAIGGHNRRVTLLGTRTFSPRVYLDHTSTIHLTSGSVYQESVSATGTRSYAVAPQPVSPPTSVTVSNTSNEASQKFGISITTFNSDGTLLASRDDSCPTTVWIWDLNSLTPRTILIQHSHVKNITWHPTLPNLLLVQDIQDEPIGYIWEAAGDVPMVIKPGLEKTNNKFVAQWMPTGKDRKPSILFGDNQSHCLVWPNGRDAILRFEHSDDSELAEENDDSLFDILSGRKPAPVLQSTQMLDFDESTRLEDTFRSRKQQPVQFEESMDESFF